MAIAKENSWQMFNSIATRYDLLNRILSLGQDLRWRRFVIERLVNTCKPESYLDIATGTGDLLIEVIRSMPSIKSAVGLDMAKEMLAIARAKLELRQLSSKVQLICADAQHLPFEDNSVDLMTISFGIRNIPDLRQALIEKYRVLRPQGYIAILEFSKPANPLLRLGHAFYMSVIVPTVGFLFSGNFNAYQYLNTTVSTFPYGQQFCLILEQFGFRSKRSYPLMGGVASLYVAQK
jgi:demethylmenaquinone methyltransferase/2-methoxy-6-polyprenyl-1,4-benzoquinol methylase